MELQEFLREGGYPTSGAGGDIRVFLAGLVQVALSTVGIIFFLMILYGGYLWLTAGGNEEQVKKARQFVTRALVGFAVTLGALILTRFVVGFLESAASAPSGGAPQTEPLFNF